MGDRAGGERVREVELTDPDLVQREGVRGDGEIDLEPGIDRAE